MRLDVSVHAARISSKLGVVLGCRHLQPFFCRCSDSEDSLLAVVLQSHFAHDLSQFAHSCPPHQIHLKEPVLRSDVPLREKQIVERGRLYRRYPMAVTNNADWRRNASYGKWSIHLRQRGTRYGEKPCNPGEKNCKQSESDDRQCPQNTKTRTGRCSGCQNFLCHREESDCRPAFQE